MNKFIQITDTVLMIQPDHFQFNEQTASDNAFQKKSDQVADVTTLAMQEFTTMVNTLRARSINVLTLKSREGVITPDAVFPNNWFTTHINKKIRTIIFYPMLAENRRLERQIPELIALLQTNAKQYEKQIDLTEHEHQQKYLEGTGSVILDRSNKIAYAAISARTDKNLLKKMTEQLDYRIITFHSSDQNNGAIYHTNVMLSIGVNFAVVASAAVTDPTERAHLLQNLKDTNKEIIEISLQQMTQMAGNILQVSSVTGDPKIVMSQTAHKAFTQDQRKILERHGELVVVAIPTIEAIGGGSARCMLAEIF